MNIAARTLQDYFADPRRAATAACRCERSEAIQRFDSAGLSGLPRRYAPRNDSLFVGCV
jgi:hypothetical protein